MKSDEGESAFDEAVKLTSERVGSAPSGTVGRKPKRRLKKVKRPLGDFLENELR